MTENISNLISLLIEALKDNYRQYSIRAHQRQLTEYGGDRCDVSHASYHEQKIDELKNGQCPIEYQVETGKKYHKVILIDGGGSRSVHCFIDKNTGDVYKSASWKSPTKGVRYNLMNSQDREYLLQHADWSGGYLYSK